MTRVITMHNFNQNPETHILSLVLEGKLIFITWIGNLELHGPVWAVARVSDLRSTTCRIPEDIDYWMVDLERTHACTHRSCKFSAERPQARIQTKDFLVARQQYYHCAQFIFYLFECSYWNTFFEALSYLFGCYGISVLQILISFFHIF